jgi:hypothetical protein
MIKTLRDLKMHYELVTAIYMLEPWEKAVFSKIIHTLILEFDFFFFF